MSNEKILKYTFKEEPISVVDGDIVFGDIIEHKCIFTAKIKAMDLFEQEYGKPLFKTFVELMQGVNPSASEKEMLVSAMALMDSKFIKALACSTYVKIENGGILNNEITKEEFKESPMYDLVLSDYEYIQSLLEMTMNCLYEPEKVTSKGKGKGKN